MVGYWAARSAVCSAALTAVMKAAMWVAWKDASTAER